MFSNDLVCDMLDFIDDNINRKITMIELSQKFFFHKDYLMRLFKKEIHVTILDYINRLRIFQSMNTPRSKLRGIFPKRCYFCC